MSINAINGISLYEYYYKINKDNAEKKKSPIAKEMEEYGLTPTEDEGLNIALLNRAKQLQEKNNNSQEQTPSYSDRPWADIMYQLDLEFNADPKDDIDDIKEKLKELLFGVNDDELEKEINELQKQVENSYIDFNNTHSTGFNSNTLSAQLENMSTLNKVNLL